MQKVNVMFVCLGNICRSPMAEAILKSQVFEANMSKTVHIESCGTGNYHIGDDADKRTLSVLKQNGIHLAHSAQQLNPSHYHQFDYLLVMDDSNLSNVQGLKPHDAQCEVLKIRAFDNVKSNQDVIDPYYGDINGFEQCYYQLDEACANFLQFLREKHV